MFIERNGVRVDHCSDQIMPDVVRALRAAEHLVDRPLELAAAVTRSASGEVLGFLDCEPRDGLISYTTRDVARDRARLLAIELLDRAFVPARDRDDPPQEPARPAFFDKLQTHHLEGVDATARSVAPAKGDPSCPTE